MSSIQKIIDNGMHICGSINIFITIMKIPNFLKIADSKDILRKNFYGYFKHSDSLYVSNKIANDHIKIFLGKGIPQNIEDNWSPEVHINNIENLLKLKCFL